MFLRRALSYVATFALGTIGGLFLTQYFVQFLPGPTIAARYSQSGEDCSVYRVQVGATEPLEFFEYEIQVPGVVGSYKVGQGTVTQLRPDLQQSVGAVFTQKNPNDPGSDCVIVGVIGSDASDLATSSQIGVGMVRVRATKLQPGAMILGDFVLSKKQPPEPVTFYIAGTYEYTRLGYIVRKPFKFVDVSAKINKEWVTD